jgi:uncharacterized membrane protein
MYKNYCFLILLVTNFISKSKEKEQCDKKVIQITYVIVARFYINVWWYLFIKYYIYRFYSINISTLFRVPSILTYLAK